MPQTPNWKDNLKKQAQFTPEQLARVDKLQQLAIAKFTGDLGELESALGLIALGHQFGWKVLAIIHSKATIRKYEEILGINIREEFPEEGPTAMRNTGFRIAKQLGNFWKVVSGDFKVPEKREV